MVIVNLAGGEEGGEACLTESEVVTYPVSGVNGSEMYADGALW